MCNLLLVDEINRASSKTQSALLEVMEEGQTTVDGVTHPLPEPFFGDCHAEPCGQRRDADAPPGAAGPVHDPHQDGISGPAGSN